MPNKNRLFIKLGILLCLSLIACGDPITRAKGVVRDKNGNPLEGVTVVMESNGRKDSPKEDERKTKADGMYSFGIITAPATQVNLVFTKEGYKTYKKEITPDKETAADVVLESDSK